LYHLSKGLLPWSTELIYGPEGGVLYFVDPLGALASLPFSALFGVGFAYNLVQISRFAFAGLVERLHRIPLRPVVLGDAPRTPVDPDRSLGLVVQLPFSL
jgi:hypothetical protein